MPVPAVNGLKVFPIIPIPEKVPPKGLPTRFTVFVVLQIVVLMLAMDTAGRVFTVTVAVLVTVTGHPAMFPLTVYTVVEVGLTVIELPAVPLLQVYVGTPLAVRVAVLPEQMLVEWTVMAGAGFTVTVAV